MVKIMIVNNNSALQSLASLYANESVRSPRRAQKPESISFKEEFSMSKEAQSFGTMLQELQDMDEVRSDKVEAYAARLASGSFNVSAENIAASMLGI